MTQFFKICNRFLKRGQRAHEEVQKKGVIQLKSAELRLFYLGAYF